MALIQYIPRTPSRLAFVGEAPGRYEMQKHQPFVGPEGSYFTRLLKAAGVNRYEHYITNTVHTQPHRNDYSTLSVADLNFGREQLKKDLIEWKEKGLTTVIAVGAKALELLTDKTGIFKFRGTVLPCTLVPGLKVYSTVHPGMLIRGSGEFEPIFILDIKKAVADSSDNEMHYPERNINIIRDKQDALFQLSQVTQIETPVVVDIETAGPVMTAFGWATSPSTAFSIASTLLKEVDILQAVGRFASSNTPKIFHNALYDVFHGAFYYQILYRNIFFDTMIAQHSAYPTLPKSLAFCASIYTNEPYWKDEGRDAMKDLKKGIMSWDALYLYNGKDCCLTYEIYLALKDELAQWEVEDVFADRMALLPACLYGQMRGLLLDEQACREFADKNEKAIEILEHIKEKTIGDLNVRSPKQLSELIYGTWGMPIQRKKGRVTVEEKKLRALLRYPTPYTGALGLIMTLRDRYKMRDFYSVKTDPDGRVRYSLKITGTYTGRLASSESITGSGTNMQNQPKEVRVIYKADPGKILCQVDLSQSEARIVAALCKDEPWLKAFDERDLHTEVASMLYHIPVEKVEKSTHRSIAKRVAHGTHYGMGYILLSEILECPPKEARRLKERYLEIRPSLKDWHRRVKKQIHETKLIRTCFGVAIQFFGPIGDPTRPGDDDEGSIGKIMREAVAAEPQSTSVSYINKGIIKSFKEIPEFDFLLQVHDSILFQLPDDPDVIKRVFEKVRDLTEVPITINDITFKIPLSFEFGYNWGTMWELKSLNHLYETYKELQLAR